MRKIVNRDLKKTKSRMPRRQFLIDTRNGLGGIALLQLLSDQAQSSVNCWGPGFLPAAFQGTDFNAAQPIRHLARPPAIAEDTDRATRAFLERLNQHHLKQFPGDTDLAARIASYQLAAKMQLSVPQVADLSTEPQQILKMYGADVGGNRVNDLKAAYARNCILARRLTDVHGKVIHDVLA
jgi:hypothetical protein